MNKNSPMPQHKHAMCAQCYQRGLPSVTDKRVGVGGNRGGCIIVADGVGGLRLASAFKRSRVAHTLTDICVAAFQNATFGT